MTGMRPWGQEWDGRVRWSESFAEPLRIKFLIQAVYDTLHSLANLQVWGGAKTPSCPLLWERST